MRKHRDVFHHNSNRRLTVDHYIRYYTDKHLSMKIVDLKAFTFKIEIIYDILAKNGSIKCISTNKDAQNAREYTREFIREENFEVKSIINKKLLTLSAV